MNASRASEGDPRLAETQAAQARAADPSVSAWVAANAGTGKTHVLTSRVLRLLLAGTKPERILCLTFTKAAAAEMSTRVFDRLAQWVSAPADKLDEALWELLRRAPTTDEALRARQLFALAIETPGGLKVQTIHAFCERLLQRFPLEAGVPPGFAILDEAQARTLMREAIDATLGIAAQGAAPELYAALQTVVVHAADDRFDRLLQAMIAKRDWLDAVRPASTSDTPSFAEAEAQYRRALGIRRDVTLDNLTDEIARILPPDVLQRAITALSGGSISDQKCAVHLQTVMAAPNAAAAVEAFKSFFLTSAGEPRKNLTTKPTANRNPGIKEHLEAAQDRFVALNSERCALLAAEGSLALVKLADAVRTDFASRKARRAALDYDDLIARAATLLAGDGGAAQWVLFKLDGGLDHILVDEAQDTSPMQWRVIANLAEEFFSDSARHGEVARTVFAVGDEKQSIYGFQGAAPHMLGEMGARFAGDVRAIGRDWHDVALTLSFRSTQPVLEAVDAVFADPVRTPGVSAASAAIRHQVARRGHGGVVEIWEPEQHLPAQEADAFMPLDERPAAPPPTRLAARIADQIAHWLSTGERLESEGRPIRAGDILILVRHRKAFAAAMIAALKQRNIPVSGADRMRLEQQIAVQDLMAAGDVVLLPEDDLALAAVLKSPLIGLDDDDLLRFAPERNGALWKALLEAADAGDTRLAEAAEIIKRWRHGADYRPPFEFYADILGDGGRERLLARLGPEAADAIDEFMDLALRYDEAEPPSLQGFLHALRQSGHEIKRDLEHGGNVVRVMTVHGAKGLEAPIVFLPDTCSARSGDSNGSLIEVPDASAAPGSPPPVVWPLKHANQVAAIVSAKRAAKREEIEERNRLLYVAMTRARDRLYVCGYEGKKAREADCWYNLIVDGLAGRLEAATAFDDRPARRFASPQQTQPKVRHGDAADDDAAIAPPDWTQRRPPREPALVIPIAPSRLAPLDIDREGEPVEPVQPLSDRPMRRPMSDSVGTGGNRFLRGTLTHALLQYLPTLPSAQWVDAASKFVDIRGASLPARARASIATETLAVLHDPGFAAVFSPGSRAEVAIVAEIAPPDGKGPKLRIAGQIDRLIEHGREILIVDYKTNRPPPFDLNDVPSAYVHQLAGYRLAVQRVFRAASIRAALLWTDGPRLMELPARLLDAAEKELFTVS